MGLIYCADMIARYADRIVIVKRLQDGTYGIVGGKQDPGETLSETALREFSEETGLAGTLTGVLGTYAEDGRDARGRYISTVFTGHAVGEPRGEPGKTEVLLLLQKEVEALYPRFGMDHARILQDYFALGR
jgi:ADP-ribose pyrophosphatase YjhB (NUDIX family)